MPAPVNDNLELYLPNGGGEAFYVQELSLREGLSAIPKAVLLLHSSTLFSLEELKAFLSQTAAVKLKQQRSTGTLGASQSLARWFGGVVTGVEHLGVLQETESEQLYGYQMTIEPSLVNLCYACHERNFDNVTPVSVISTLLEEAGISFDLKYLNAANNAELSKCTCFYQNGESDYVFLRRIFATYGISFNYRAVPCDAAATVIKPPVLYLFGGLEFLPSSEMEPALAANSFPLAFHSRNRDAGGYALLNWKMVSRIGVDSVSMDYQTANGGVIHQQSGDSASLRGIHFNHSPYGTLTQDTIAVTTDNVLKGLTLFKTHWTGETLCLEAMPGTAINVLEFYGSSNSTAINALISGTALYCRAPVNPQLSSAEGKEAVQSIQLTCIACDGAARFTTVVLPVFVQEPMVESESSADEVTVNLQSTAVVEEALVAEQDGVDDGDELFQAIVCDKSGKYSGSENSASCLTQSASGDKNYRFNAVLVSSGNADEQISVWMVMPLAGTGQGLFRVPRIGERILVAKIRNSDDYYLLGYLPCDDMKFAASLTDVSDGQGSINDSIMLRYYQTTSKGATPAYVADANSTIPWKRYNEKDATPRFTELGFYTLKDDSGNAQPTVNLQSTGDVRISATDNVEHSSNNVSFTGATSDKTGAVKIANLRKLVVDVEDSIALSVGNTLISINQGGISLLANRWSQTCGPLMTGILINSNSGVLITGMNCVMKGHYSAVVTDGTGANVAFGAGNATVTGVANQLSTIGRKAFVFNSIATMEQLGTEIFGFIVGACASEKASSVYDNVVGTVNMLTYGFRDLWDDIDSVKELWKDTNTKAGKANFAAGIILLLAHLADSIQWAAEYACLVVASGYDENKPDEAAKMAKVEAWMDTPINDSNVTNRDAFRLAVLGLTTVGWSINVIVSMTQTSSQHKSKILIRGGDIALTTEQYNNTALDQFIQSCMSQAFERQLEV